MPNLSQVIKAEIARISRREIKAAVNPLRTSTIVLKKTAAQFKKRIAVLESDNKRLRGLQDAFTSREKAQSAEEPDRKVRITSKSIQKLRTKLGLSQESLAKLIGVSSQAIYLMEHKAGRLKLRSTTLSKLLTIKGMGKREAQAKLQEMEHNSKAAKKAAKRN